MPFDAPVNSATRPVRSKSVVSTPIAHSGLWGNGLDYGKGADVGKRTTPHARCALPPHEPCVVNELGTMTRHLASTTTPRNHPIHTELFS